MKNRVCVITIAFILAITTTACQPSDKPIESTSETTTTVSEAITTTSAQTTALTTTTPPSTTQTIESSESETQATTQPQETSEIEELTPLLTDEDFTFINDFGDNMDIRYADLIWFDYDHYIEPEEMFKENYYTIIYNQFTYLTKSLGVSYNSLDDSYDFETGVFDVEVPEQNYEWFKVYLGDKFGPLTVEETRVDYDYFEGKVYDGDFRVKFSGSLSLEGYIHCFTEDEGYVAQGDVYLFPDAQSWGDIPILLLKSDIGYLQKADFEDNHNNFYYSSDLEAINLGNIYQEYYADFDFSMLPNDGSYLRAEVTLTDLLYWKKTRSTGMRYNAKIESISLLDE